MSFIKKYKLETTHISGHSVKKIDTLMKNKYQVGTMQLMEIAGLRLAEFIKKKSTKTSKIYIFVGSGNNGADGLVAARFLNAWNINVIIFLLKSPHMHKTITKTQLESLDNLNIAIDVINSKTKFLIQKDDIIVDALLGVSLTSKPNEIFKKVIHIINSIQAIKISVDIPSGLNTFTAKLYSSHVKSNYILSFMCAKNGFEKLKDTQIYIADIGLNLKKMLKEIKSI